MALDAVVFPQEYPGYICSFKHYFQGLEEEISGGSISEIMDTHSWSYEHLGFHEVEAGDKCDLLASHDTKNDCTNLTNCPEPSQINTCVNDQWVPTSNSSPDELHSVFEMPTEDQQQKDQQVTTRRKRRRTKASKNKEEVENQRMTHIAVERNRRKQMNEYLAVLRSLMPSSYAQRGDQASIIGGAINFVKELEQLLQTLEAEQTTKNHHQKAEQQDIKAQEDNHSNNATFLSPFSHFFTFPQYTTKPTTESASTMDTKLKEDQSKAAAAADIEVTIVENHASVKILAKRCPKQLVKLVSSFQSLKLTILHLNVSSHDYMVLYSISVKVEEGCQLNSVDEIAASVNEMLHKIKEES